MQETEDAPNHLAKFIHNHNIFLMLLTASLLFLALVLASHTMTAHRSTKPRSSISNGNHKRGDAVGHSTDNDDHNDDAKLKLTLPESPCRTWKHRPLYITADASTGTRIRSTSTTSSSSNEVDAADTGDDDAKEDSNGGRVSNELPLGVPIAFESDLFVGHILFRFKALVDLDDAEEGKGDDDSDPSTQNGDDEHRDVGDDLSHMQTSAAYFKGRKRRWQYVVQGRFKQPLVASDLYTGDVYSKPLKGLPPPFLLHPVEDFVKMMVPGIHFDIADSDQPQILTLYGSVQTLRVDEPGQEPNICDIDLQEESTAMLDSIDGSDNNNQSDDDENDKYATVGRYRRKKLLSNPTKASQYTFDTNHVHTFDHFDHIMDYGTYEAHFGGGMTIDLAQHLDGQPMSIGALVPNNNNGNQWMFRFHVFHERAMEGNAATQSDDDKTKDGDEN